jgi:hypothetical protein
MPGKSCALSGAPSRVHIECLERRLLLSATVSTGTYSTAPPVLHAAIQPIHAARGATADPGGEMIAGEGTGGTRTQLPC